MQQRTQFWRWFSQALTVSMISACARSRDFVATDATPRHSLRSDVQGCWSLSHARQDTIARGEGWAPAIVRLDSALVGGPSAVTRLAVRLDHAEQPLPMEFESGITGQSTWTADANGDGVRVTFNNGFFGSTWAWTVKPSPSVGDTVWGTSQRFTDVAGETHAALPIFAVRMRCQLSGV